MKKKILAVFLLSLVVSATAYAGRNQNDIYLGIPEYGGTGCPPGTAHAILSPDAKSLSVLFDQYYFQTNPGSKIGRANCSVAVPVHVPQGMSVSLLQVDHRGYADIPGGATGNFTVDYFFAGQKGPTHQKNFGANFSNNFLVSDTLGVTAIVWSKCGEDVILRSNSSIRANKSNAWGNDAYMQVDSVDVSAGILYKLQWKFCN